MESKLLEVYEHYKRKADEYEELLKERGELPKDMIEGRDKYEKRLTETVYQVDALDVESLKAALWDRIDIMGERYTESLDPVSTVVLGIIDKWLEDKEV